MSERPLENRVALVTGAGKGIGRAAAIALAQDGAHVMGVARTQEHLDELAASHPEISTYAAALDTPEGCRAAVDEARSVLGPVEILVNNAGIGAAGEQRVWEEDPARWHLSMAINLHAPFELIRLTAPEMVAAGRGRIVVVSSTAGQIGAPAMPAYCAAKHGVIGLVRAAAVDLAPYGVTCNAVNPGTVQTAMSDRSALVAAERQGVAVEEIWAQRRAEYAAGRLPTAEEVANTIRFLAGPYSSGISGEAVTVALGDVW